jgi:hypothetical protein
MEPVSVVRPFDDVAGRIRSVLDDPTSVLKERGESSGQRIEKHGLGEVFE